MTRYMIASSDLGPTQSTINAQTVALEYIRESLHKANACLLYIDFKGF